ncbi:thermonuclease family protein [Brevibacillus ruminantium]|uniref:Thermonuclease family protein n=1 Tax=Brevibacillus ruminantium TaxID=2950604 RepID=A0ABY4WEF5_9BACL|nr:thermonuclease family protein [Brevibacillus ruminantium]USG63694.1 thermonuclease family protein [Brevibacillus ruminantium]
MKRLLGWLAVLACFLYACGAPEQPKANGEISATVSRVVDGDTFEISTGEKVRLIGVDTPETVKPNHPVEPYGKEASDFSKKLLTGQEVRLVFDVEPYDRYKRLLAYVYLSDGTFVNEKLVRDGYARIMTVPPNVAKADLFLEAEREARENNRGLWGLEDQEDTASQKKSAKSGTPSEKSVTPAEEAPSPDQLIKGNINSKGEKIYHVPGSRNYDQTKAEVWFATEEEAQAAGFRAPKR